ncbi:hypothetical protein P5F77_05935 [Caldifermentibacillus hisashii]|uniref:hypothetical protein n=1 Tax=Caldifermentibacillus hisashii TaxID=996558 RepID=UPI0030D6B556
MLNFGDETHSRHHFAMRNPHFWRRDPFSSSFRGGKLYLLTTSLILVVILR